MKKFLALFILILSSCSKSTPSNSAQFNGWAMTMPYHITVGSKIDYDQQKQIDDLIQDCFNEVNQTVNNWNPGSEVSLLNLQPANTKHIPSTHLSHLLSLSQEINQLSNGKFDPTIEPLTKAWKQALDFGLRPSESELMAIQKNIGWHHIELQEKSVSKRQDGTALDLCAISKGYCIDLITERLISAGFKNLFVEWAGEIRAAGSHPTGRNWTVQIEPMQQITQLNNCAIATSGDYSQKEWGQGYFHIIDPIKCEPMIKKSGSISAVTVIAPTCALADALATTLMLFETKQEAEDWAQSIIQIIPEISVVILNNQAFIPNLIQKSPFKMQ